MPLRLQEGIKALGSSFTIRNASCKTVPVVGTISFLVQICTSQSTLTFLVAEQLATELILSCDCCYNFVEVIRHRRSHVEIKNGSIFPIVRQPPGSQSELSLLDDKDPTSMYGNGWIVPNIQV